MGKKQKNNVNKLPQQNELINTFINGTNVHLHKLNGVVQKQQTPSSMKRQISSKSPSKLRGKRSNIINPHMGNSTNGEKVEKNGTTMHKNPSANTINLIERQNIVLWRSPFLTFYYFIMEVLCMMSDCLKSFPWQRIGFFIVPMIPGLLYYHLVPGVHWDYSQHVKDVLFRCLYWIGLGVMSSVGLGTGLHTFLIYLGPHIARVTMAAFECNSIDFPEPPYPNDVICPNNKPADEITTITAITLWHIISKVRLESLMWGAGTALGELPPYFMARASRLSGDIPDDDDFKEFLAWKEAAEGGGLDGNFSILDRIKIWMEQIVTKVGFFGILLFASIPNPFFDLAGITCGHFLIPFWTFFGATLIGKALVKMHIQMLFVVLAFSEHHVENLLDLIVRIPKIGSIVQAPLREFFAAQKMRLHRKPGDPVSEQPSGLLQMVLSVVVSVMIICFGASLINSLAQRYHKRLWDASKKKASSKKTR